MNTGRTEQELEDNVFQAQGIAQKHNCNLRRLDFQQEQGLMSSLPLAQNLIEIRRSLTTSSTAIFVPFTTQELFQNNPVTLKADFIFSLCELIVGSKDGLQPIEKTVMRNGRRNLIEKKLLVQFVF